MSVLGAFLGTIAFLGTFLAVLLIVLTIVPPSENGEDDEPEYVIARKSTVFTISDRTPDELAELLEGRDRLYDFSKHFSQEDVPALMALLKKPKYLRQWSTAITIAAAVDKQHVSQSHIIRYLKTDYSRTFDERKDIVSNQYVRMNAMAMLGFVADKQGIEVLETIALSNDGLYDVTEDWIHKPIANYEREQFIAILRGKAATGLVYSQNQSSIAKLEELHLETVDTLTTVLQTYHLVDPSYMDWIAEFTSEEAILMHLHGHLVTALSIRDAIIEQGGMHEFRTRIEGFASGGIIGVHMSKYEMD